MDTELKELVVQTAKADRAKAVSIVRNKLGVGPAEAVRIVNEISPIEKKSDIEVSLCTLLIFSRACSAIVRCYEIYQPLTAARAVLGREPDFEDSGIFSWGNINIDEVTRLMLHGDEPDADGAKDIWQWGKQYSGDGYLWSVFYRQG